MGRKFGRCALTVSLALAPAAGALAQEGSTSVEISQVGSSTTGGVFDALPEDQRVQLAPAEYEPPRPPTAAEVEGASTPDQSLKLFERESQNYVGVAETFKDDIRDLILTRYNAEKERISGHYERNIRDLEDQERQRRLDAIARFEEFLRKYPSDPFYTPDAMFRLAELYFERSSDEYLAATKTYERDQGAFERGELATEPAAPKPNFGDTIALYNDLLARFPDYRHADAARYLLGYAYEEMDQKAEALASYQVLVERYPSSRFLAEVWTRIGEIYFDENAPDSLEKASNAYANVLKFPDSPYYDKAMYKLAWTYYRMDRLPDAVGRFIALVEYADKQRAATGKSGSELRAESIQYIAISLSDDRWGGLARAKEVLEPLADKAYAAEIWKRYGEVLFDQTKFPEAIEIFRMTIARYPNAPQNPEVQYKIVTAYERMRDFDGATKAREELVKNFDDGSSWSEANGADKAALASARELMERSLYTAAIYNHQQAQAFRKANRAADAKSSYVRAAENYRIYLKRFPDSKNSYDFNFFLAECLYYSEDYMASAKQYEMVRDSNADNKHLNDAALSAVIAYEKVIELDEGAGKLAKLEFKKASDRKDQKVEPKQLAPLRLDLVKASDRFTTLLTTSDRSPAVAYRAAELYYKHDQFDEARARFEKVIIAYPNSEVARYSANLIIETYLAAEDWDNVQKWSQRLMEIAQNSKGESAEEKKARADLVENLKNFKVGAQFKKAEELDAKGEFEQAADLYVALVNDQPDHQFADKALFNAAVAYEKVNRFDAASKIYQRIYDNYPKSELADRALFRVGVNFEKGFDFPGAIQAYTQLVERYPKSEFRADSLYNVAVTLENQQQYGQAAVAFKRYAETFPDREDAGEVYFRSALVLEKMESWADVTTTLDNFVKKFGKNAKLKDRMVEARKRMGDAYQKQGKNTKSVAEYEECLREYKRRGFSTADRASTQAAQCAFEIAEDAFRTYDALKIEGTGKKQAATLTEKAKQQRRVEQLYTDVFQYKRAETTLAALYRAGYTYERFAETMYAAEVPPEFKSNEDLANEYRIQLEDKAAVLERKAESAYRKAYDEAIKTRVTNEWTQKILEGLNKYRPDEFPVQKEGKGALQMVVITGQGLDDGTPPAAPAPAPAPAAPAPKGGQ